MDLQFTKVSTSRLAEVHPVLQTRASALVAAWLEKFPGFTLQISQGLRSWNEQNAYWVQGREPLDVVNQARKVVQLSPITAEQNADPQGRVTNAPPGRSNHNYGFAVDFVVESSDGILDWNASDERWGALILSAAQYSLRSGACWGDKPHVELVEVPTDPTDTMLWTLKNQGIEAVWKEFPQLAA